MARTADWAAQPGHLIIRRAFQLASAEGHGEEVERLIAEVLPEYAERYRSVSAEGELRIARLRRRRRQLPNFMVGWPTWFANRRVGLRDRWFALTSRAAYRGQPPL